MDPKEIPNMHCKPDGKNNKTPSEVASAAPCSSLDVANAMIRQQEYLLNRQHDMIEGVIRRNVELVKATNECHRENHKLKKELEGYKRGRLWTMFASFLPTVSFGDDLF